MVLHDDACFLGGCDHLVEGVVNHDVMVIE